MQPTNTASGQNPFAGILASLGGGSSLGASPTGGTTQGPSAMPNPAGGSQGGANRMATQAQEDVTQKGVNPGGSKFLIGALQQMNNFITESTDPREITIARNIISILNSLIKMDQAKQQGVMSQQQSILGSGNPVTGRNLGLMGSTNMQQPYPMGASNASPSTGITSSGGAA